MNPATALNNNTPPRFDYAASGSRNRVPSAPLPVVRDLQNFPNRRAHTNQSMMPPMYPPGLPIPHGPLPLHHHGQLPLQPNPYYLNPKTYDEINLMALVSQLTEIETAQQRINIMTSQMHQIEEAERMRLHFAGVGNTMTGIRPPPLPQAPRLSKPVEVYSEIRPGYTQVAAIPGFAYPSGSRPVSLLAPVLEEEESMRSSSGFSRFIKGCLLSLHGSQEMERMCLQPSPILTCSPLFQDQNWNQRAQALRSLLFEKMT